MTKSPRDHTACTNREIEADPQGYRAAQHAHREDRAQEAAARREEEDRERFRSRLSQEERSWTDGSTIFL
jgi:hypothetical protein